MSNFNVDLSFCDSCEFRGTLISGGSYCARTGLDNMQSILGQFAGANVITIDGQEPSTPVEELEISFGAEYLLDVVNCIESVRTGGNPVEVTE